MACSSISMVKLMMIMVKRLQFHKLQYLMDQPDGIWRRLNRRGKSAISTMCLIQNHFESLLCSSSYHHRECHNEKDRHSTFWPFLSVALHLPTVRTRCFQFFPKYDVYIDGVKSYILVFKSLIWPCVHQQSYGENINTNEKIDWQDTLISSVHRFAEQLTTYLTYFQCTGRLLRLIAGVV